MKLNGEGGRGSSGYTPSSVSFWYYQNGNPFPSGGHARARSFEFPMAIGINRSQVSHLQASGVGLYHGSMHGEVTIENQVKWSDITHVFVPSFKVAEVTQILRAHGIVHVKVFPLAHGKSEEAI
jgi:hypothetical protein